MVDLGPKLADSRPRRCPTSSECCSSSAELGPRLADSGPMLVEVQHCPTTVETGPNSERCVLGRIFGPTSTAYTPTLAPTSARNRPPSARSRPRFQSMLGGIRPSSANIVSESTYFVRMSTEFGPSSANNLARCWPNSGNHWAAATTTATLMGADEDDEARRHRRRRRRSPCRAIHVLLS